MVGQQSVYVGAINNLAQPASPCRSSRLSGMATSRASTPSWPQDSGPGRAAALTPSTNGNGQAGPAWKGEYLASRDAEGKPIFNRAALARDGLTEAQATQLHAGWNDQLADIFRGPETFEERIAKIVEARVGQATQQTEQKLTAAQQQALYNQQQAAAAERAKLAYRPA